MPFCSDFNEIFLNDKNYQNILEKYYKNNLVISLKENNSYFEELKSKNISSSPNIYYQSLEIYNVLNIGNVFNIRNIFSYLNNNYKNKININFLFAFKMVINFLSTTCSIQSRQNYGLNNLLGILNSLNLNIKEITKLIKEIFFFQSISFINNATHNILFINEKYQILIKNFLQAKYELVDGLIKMFYEEKVNYNLIFSEHKIFLVKNAIIKVMNDEEILDMYNALKNLKDFNEISGLIKDNKLKDEILDIYSN